MVGTGSLRHSARHIHLARMLGLRSNPQISRQRLLHSIEAQTLLSESVRVFKTRLGSVYAIETWGPFAVCKSGMPL
jgi:hypothetical protein